MQYPRGLNRSNSRYPYFKTADYLNGLKEPDMHPEDIKDPVDRPDDIEKIKISDDAIEQKPLMREIKADVEELGNRPDVSEDLLRGGKYYPVIAILLIVFLLILLFGSF